MKKILVLSLFTILQYHSYGQASKLFDIKEIIVTDTLNRKIVSDFQKENPNFFEDASYIVRKTCRGEWGGTIWFKDKKTGIEYSCSATCPVVVNKLGGKYIITNTLAHLSAFSEILEIDNPRLLEVFKRSEPGRKKGKKIRRYVGDDESRSTKGTLKLVDTIGILTLATFNYNDELYHIITNFRNTYIAKLENKRFVNVCLLSEKNIWTYNPEVIKTKDGHSIVFFKNEEVEGYLDIFGRKITIIRYR